MEKRQRARLNEVRNVQIEVKQLQERTKKVEHETITDFQYCTDAIELIEKTVKNKSELKRSNAANAIFNQKFQPSLISETRQNETEIIKNLGQTTKNPIESEVNNVKRKIHDLSGKIWSFKQDKTSKSYKELNEKITVIQEFIYDIKKKAEKGKFNY